MRTPRLPLVDWTDVPTVLSGLVRFGERRNLVSARVPSRFKRSLPVRAIAVVYRWSWAVLCCFVALTPCKSSQKFCFRCLQSRNNFVQFLLGYYLSPYVSVLWHICKLTRRTSLPLRQAVLWERSGARAGFVPWLLTTQREVTVVWECFKQWNCTNDYNVLQPAGNHQYLYFVAVSLEI
jgi:hypothetical protein